MPLNELISQLELDGIRADAEQLFVDEGLFRRKTDDGPLNLATSQYDSPTYVDIYQGRCSIYPIEARRDRVDDIGQGLVYTRQYRIVLPYDVPPLQIRDIFIPIASQDFDLIGREMETRDVLYSTNLGYRRVTVHDMGE